MPPVLQGAQGSMAWTMYWPQDFHVYFNFIQLAECLIAFPPSFHCYRFAQWKSLYNLFPFLFLWSTLVVCANFRRCCSLTLSFPFWVFCLGRGASQHTDQQLNENRWQGEAHSSMAEHLHWTQKVPSGSISDISDIARRIREKEETLESHGWLK